MNNYFLRFIQVCVFCLDVISLNFSNVICKIWFQFPSIASHELEYMNLLVWMNISWLGTAWLTNLYSKKIILSFEAFSQRTLNTFLYWLILVVSYLFFLDQYIISGYFIGAVFLNHFIVLLFNRLLLLYLRYYFKRHKLLARKIMIVGYNNTAKKLASYLEDDDPNTQIIGFCEEKNNVRELSNYPIIDSIDNTITAARFYDVNEVYSTIAPEHNTVIYKLMKQADNACIHFRIIPDLSFIIKKVVYINYFKDIPVLSLREEPLSDVDNRIKKRVFDIVFSFLVITLILSWLIPIIGLLIYLESPGPIFFKQLRTGKDKKPFYCIKFRSMRLNSEANTKQAQKFDVRITRIGKFLRRTSIDEFPQFLNVLWGNMSVVGPRPHMLKHTDDYSKLIDQYMVRQFLKPGITGWAQINGFRGETKILEQMQGRVQHDIWYMENWSLLLDIKIIFLTIINMFRGERNAF
ncbi:undecaprenyl-phosphate glucose phosphotransferase [Flavisolibacter tropicus]|uniref:UDP-phosphate glucose phosphotransferase n=1 Tax=Flavisolibacter tropicus TaxID=1492898 RepID=A0A172TS56_9BACT|nr:undecaprenyl-phosphate glucose phosphotransferase [Flavisolibacter tropicus]ANE49627.1 UDP-phosphate glucose phosphotransferase [Flavisolibacter tropicus]